MPAKGGSMDPIALLIVATAAFVLTHLVSATPLRARLGTLALDRRKRADPNWPRFARATSHVPFVAIAQGRNRLVWGEIGWLRPLIGLVAFAVLLALHLWLFGARPY